MTFGETLYGAGITDLVSVIPPGAVLTPTSKVPQAAIGKAPGRKLPSGLWAGYDWRRHIAAEADVAQWALDGASLGLRADRFPGVDIDVLDPQLAGIIQDAAFASLGPAAVRTGRAPKRLLMYRTDEPFSRMRLWVTDRGVEHLVEILGTGQQYVVAGIHPTTMQPYTWSERLGRQKWLVPINRESAAAFLDQLTETLEMVNCVCKREGDGKLIERATLDQTGLVAPTPELLAAAVAAIPNTNDLFPDRTSYLKMGYAIRAAAGDDNEETGFELFSGWAAKWDGNARFDRNDPNTVHEDWRRMTGSKAVGWNWLAEQARGFGFSDATSDFEAIEDARADEPAAVAPDYSDRGLAETIIAARKSVLRFVPATGTYLVWDGSRWKVDADLLAESIIDDELRIIGDRVMRHGVTEKEKREALALATRLCGAGTASSVATVARRNRALAVPVERLDHDPWLLNTPGGIVDLTTGVLGSANPDALCTKSTAVAPASMHTPRWSAFLDEATAGDVDLVGFLRRLSGYCLTGSTREQQLTFIHGKGGTGKSVFLKTIAGVLAEYTRNATMETFTASNTEKHSTDVAMLLGARLVTASETTAGKRWDEARVKQLTGGDTVTARFMRQDNISFVPSFKLIFVGNHKPVLRDVDDAMKRRIQIVPFNTKPAVVDTELGAKLRAEMPGILAWMIEGCLEWQRDGLLPPASVQVSTSEYFTDQDSVGAWLAECTTPNPAGEHTSVDLFDSWREWAGRNGEYVGTLKRLVEALKGKGIPLWQQPITRRRGFAGLSINSPATGFEVT